MNILGFDTETTGLIDLNISPDDPQQPWPVQIAAVMTDETGAEQSSFSFLVNPPVAIQDGAFRAHGISQARCAKYGVKPITAITMLYSMVCRADVIVGHNLDFDVNVIKLGKLRLALDHPCDYFDAREHFCTQRRSAELVNLDPTDKMILAGFTFPKSPKLAEAYKFFFGEEILGAHDAMVDTRAALRIYFEIKRREAERVGSV